MVRKLLAIICGLIAGAYLNTEMQKGLGYRFPGESESWGLFIWDEHWFLKFLITLISASWAGFIAGVIARSKGGRIGIISILPFWLVLAIFEYSALARTVPFIDYYVPYISIGNKFFLGVTLLGMIPIAGFSGIAGSELGREYGEHFDSRPRTLFGIMWYHYLWLPPILTLIVRQATFAGLYFLHWEKIMLKSYQAIIPFLFVMLLLGTFYLMWKGLTESYLVLSGLKGNMSKKNVFVQVLKYIFGYQIAAIILQNFIEFGPQLLLSFATNIFN